MRNLSISKRFFALVMAVLLTVSTVPAQAFAMEDASEQQEQAVSVPAEGETPAPEPETPQEPEITASPSSVPAEPAPDQPEENSGSGEDTWTPPATVYPGLTGLTFGPGELTADTWDEDTFQPETYDYLLSRTEGTQFVHLLLDYNAELFEAIVTWEDSGEEPAELSWPSGGGFDDITLLPLLSGSTIFTITVRERQNPDNYVIYTLGVDCGEAVSTFAMAAAEDARTAAVSVTAQDGSFFLAKTNVTVSAGLSETYGYTDTVSASESVSTLDVLIRVHELLYGESDVKNKLTVTDSGWITSIFGKGMNCGFAVNGSQPGGDLVNQAKVKDGDFVEFFYYQDPGWGDLYTWFADPSETGASTAPLPVITGQAGAEVPVQLRGIPFMMIGYGGEETAIDSAEVWIVDISSGEILPPALGTISNGVGTLTLPAEAGTYYITAIASTGTPIIQPLQKLAVTQTEAAPALKSLQHYHNGYKDIDLRNPTMEIPATETSYMILARWEGDYTVTASYPGNDAGIAMTSDEWAKLTNLPYGVWELTITVTDNGSGKRSVYTVAVTHPEPERSEDKTLYAGGIRVEYGDYPNIQTVTVYQADAEGKPTESTEILDSHKTYYAQLPSGVETFKFTASPNDGGGKVRYCVNNGDWQSWGPWSAPAVTAPAAIQFQILDEKSYAADPEDWSGANSFTIWVDITKVPQSLAVTKAPKKTVYLAGESFDPTGMKVTVTYSDETTEIIPNEELTFTPDTFTNETEVTITYKELTTTQNVTVLRGLEGQGTEDSPFLIRTAEDAVAFSEMVAAGMQFKGQYVHLVNDITLPVGWIPVGSVSNPSDAITSGTEKTAFYGTFEGNNHTITVPAGGMPFFGTLGGKSGTEALVRDLNIYGTQIESNGLVAWYVTNQSYTLENITVKSGTRTLRSGLMSGYGNTPVTIRNCTVEQGVTIGYDGQQSLIGSFAADFNGTIENCASAATVKGVNFVGGIVGSKGQTMRPFEVKNCTFSGSVIASGENAGGIVGGGYAGTIWGVASAPNTPMVTIQDCTVTGSVRGNQNVGGILGGEPGIAQCWANGAGYVEGNVMRGTVSGNENVGAIIGYMHSLNRYTLISGNQYTENCGSDKPIGGAWLVDTNMENPTPVDGVQYICTEGDTSGCPSVQFCSWKKAHHREDDPLGADADTLATVIAAPRLSGLSLPADSLEGTMTPAFDAGTTSYSATLLEHQDTLALTVTYPQGAAATATYSGKTVTLNNGTATILTELPTGEVPVTITLTGVNGSRTYTLRVTNPAAPVTVTALSITGYQTEYEVGAPKLDLTGATITATLSDNTTIQVDPRYVTFSSFDSSTPGTKTITLTYEGASTTMTVTVKAAASTATVYFTLLGDSSHGETSSPHTLAEGGLTTWIGRKAYAVSAGDTVRDVLEKACQENNISIIGKGTEYGYYIEGLTRNGVTLSEFSNGSNSGWMYTLNGHHPDKSVDGQKVTAGDEIVFHYTDDYTWEEGSEEWLTVTSIAISGTFQKTYTLGDPANWTGMVITATMNNGQKKTVPLSKVAITGYDPFKKGTYPVTVSYQGKSASFNVTVKLYVGSAPKVIKLTVKPKETIEKGGKVLDGAVITALKNDGTEIHPEAGVIQVKDFDSQKLGKQTVTFTYNKISTTAEVTVVEKGSASGSSNGNNAPNRGSSSAAKKYTTEEVVKLIDSIGEVTLEKQDAINKARQAYEQLSASEKEKVTNYQTLLDAEAALYALLGAGLSLEDIYRTTGKFLYETVPQPAVGFVGGEWAVLGLARSGYPVADGYFDIWYQSLVNVLKENSGVLHDKRYTDYSRTVLALTAAGYDVTNVAGYNLLEPLADFDKVVWQGINGAIFGLIALDSHEYEIPAAPAGVKQTTREDLVDHILSLEVSGGGWSLAGGADVDITAMAIQALAPYCKDNKKVAEAVERGLTVLSAMQNDRGSYSNGYDLNSESCAQVIVALTALGIDPTTDARFIKNGRSVMDAMVEFYVSGGGFRHVMDGEVNGMATEQGYYALVSYYRFLEGKTRLYDMTDVVLPEPEVLPTEPETLPTEPETVQEREREDGTSILLTAAAVLAGAGGLAVVVLLVLKRKQLI